MINMITLPLLNDFHAHLRRGAMLQFVVEQMRGRGYGYVLVMSNPDPPIFTAEDVIVYRNEIMRCNPDFVPLFTIYLTANTTPEMIFAAKRAGAIAVKYYPAKRGSGKNVTTNSGHGFHPDDLLTTMRPTLHAMEEEGLVLCLHAEHPDAPEGKEEEWFHHTIHMLAIRYPKLRIVIEHASDGSTFSLVETYDNVAMTVTPHHLLLTKEDVEGNAFNLCKPVAKTLEDRQRLRHQVTLGHPRVFAGTDSAPHPRRTKEPGVERLSFGIYTAPHALPLYVQVFEEMDALKRLPNFIAHNSCAYYDLTELPGQVMLARKPWTVPDEPDPDHPRLFWAGRTLNWRIQS